MSFDALAAARAYGAAARPAAQPSAAPGQGGADFAGMVRDAVSDAHASLARAENLTAQAAYGQADLVDVTTAVAAAEVTVESVIAVRDQVISAYQEIMRMPI